MNEQTKARIKELQKEKDVVILAHYYVDGEVQEIADYVAIRTIWRRLQRQWNNRIILFWRCLLYG